jgi:hypothetical protein
MSTEKNIELTNIYGPAVKVSAEQVGDLIASLQCLSGSIDDGEFDHNANVLKRRLEDMGIAFDRRDTAEYQKEMGDDQDAEEAPTP